MKQLINILFLLFAFNASSCPACNIHNYLYSSVKASSLIYRGKVVASKKDNKAMIEVLEIFKDDENKIVELGELVTVHLYNVEGKIGNEFLFSNPMTSGVKFEILDTRHSWEVKYLLDSTRIVSSVTEAIRLLECVSTKSNRDGLDYIDSNFSFAYDSLYQRIVEFRKECQTYSDDFYYAYRITNLIRALTRQKDSRTLKILLQEVDSIQLFDPGILKVDSLKYNGISPIGEYLRQILIYSQKAEYLDELIDKYVNVLNNHPTSAGIYFAYALSFSNLKEIDSLIINDDNRHYITLGILSTALWYRYYWQRTKIKPLLDKIEEINEDPEIITFIEKRFDI